MRYFGLIGSHKISLSRNFHFPEENNGGTQVCSINSGFNTVISVRGFF